MNGWINRYFIHALAGKNNDIISYVNIYCYRSTPAENGASQSGIARTTRRWGWMDVWFLMVLMSSIGQTRVHWRGGLMPTAKYVCRDWRENLANSCFVGDMNKQHCQKQKIVLLCLKCLVLLCAAWLKRFTFLWMGSCVGFYHTL